MKQQTIIFWSEHFEKQKQTGLTQKEYCIHNNLSEKYFANVKAKISKLNLKKNNLVKIPFIPENNRSIFGKIELVVNDRYQINIHSDFEPETLKKLLKAIEEQA